MSKLNGKVAIVTGGSKAIGAGISTALAAAGAAVVVNYSSSREAGDQMLEQIIAAGGKAIAVQGDISKAADVDQLFAKAQTEYGHLDILVNNAGVFQFDSIETFQEEEFHREFNINVLGPLFTIQRAIKRPKATASSISSRCMPRIRDQHRPSTRLCRTGSFNRRIQTAITQTSSFC
jgi:3-oxoacyl-[acyl-carrier protein] reductase